MNHFQLTRSYIEAIAFKMLPIPDAPSSDGLGDDRGLTFEQVVIYGAAALGAAAVGGVLWATLKGGAEAVTVPTPQAP